jgi:hypothetical protein
MILWTLLVVLILASTAELGLRGFRRALADMQDFAVIYASTRAFESGKNPYDPTEMRSAWHEAGPHNPGDPAPDDLALYPPTTYLLMSPLALLDWSSVRWAYLFLNLIAIAVLVVTLTRYGPRTLPAWKIAFTAAFILGFGPIHTALAKGQLVVIVAAILALAFVAEIRQAFVLAPVLVALAGCLKPQIAAPVVVLYLIQKRWKPIATCAAVSLGILGLAALRLYLAAIPWVGSMLRNIGLASAPGGVYDSSPTNPIVFQLVNASALFHRLNANQPLVIALLATIAALVCFVLWKRGLQGPDLFSDLGAFSVACVLGLVLISHRYYDATVMVFVVAWALQGVSTRLRTAAWISIAGCLIMAFPLQALLITAGYARAPYAIPQVLWDTFVIQHQAWVLLIVLFALTVAQTGRLNYAYTAPIR